MCPRIEAYADMRDGWQHSHRRHRRRLRGPPPRYMPEVGIGVNVSNCSEAVQKEKRRTARGSGFSGVLNGSRRVPRAHGRRLWTAALQSLFVRGIVRLFSHEGGGVAAEEEFSQRQ